VKTKEWIVIRTEVFRFGLPSSGAIEHAAHRHAINGRGSDAEPNDSTSEDVHDQHHPMAPHEDRFNAEQIDTPDAVLGVVTVKEDGAAGRGTRVETSRPLQDDDCRIDPREVPWRRSA
jgi:hypothetical protein